MTAIPQGGGDLDSGFIWRLRPFNVLQACSPTLRNATVLGFTHLTGHETSVRAVSRGEESSNGKRDLL